VVRFTDTPETPAAVGRALNADVVLCGGVRRSGDQVRVSVQLVDAASEATLWAARFDEAAADVFALEDSLSARAADALALELTRGERQSLARRPTADTEAYDLYIRGRVWLSRRVGDSMQQAAECFRRALDRDPGFALAHAGLAEAYTLLSIASATLDPEPPRRMAPLAKAAAQRALAIDDRLSEAYGILGHIGYCYDWDWPKAEASIRRALELNPGNATARQWYAMGLSSLDRHEEALEQIRLARLLDPTNMVNNANLGFILYRARRYDEAVQQLRSTVAMDPSSAYARFRFGLALEAAGRADEALAQYDAMLALPKAEMHALVGKAHLLATLGRRDDARELLGRLKAMAQDRYVSAYYFAEVHAGLGEAREALDWLDAACEERPVMMISLRANLKFDALRDHPRFREIERRVGIWDDGQGAG
jgi:eukaryotic-like serine/threonine-protein kinase